MATNSIIIANLPDWAPKTPNTEDGPGSGPESPSMILPFTFIESLRAVIEGYRAIVHWIPMRSFRRIFCVFVSEEDAETVKRALNGCVFEGHRLDVFFGEKTPLVMEKKLLEPPVLQRNWMISPPGSPTEGWVQVEEEAPNSVTLHEDIQAALDRLANQYDQKPDEEEPEEDNCQGKVILDTTSHGGVQVIVHDWDSRELFDDEFGGSGIHQTNVAAIGRTPRPPLELT